MFYVRKVYYLLVLAGGTLHASQQPEFKLKREDFIRSTADPVHEQEPDLDALAKELEETAHLDEAPVVEVDVDSDIKEMEEALGSLEAQFQDEKKKEEADQDEAKIDLTELKEDEKAGRDANEAEADAKVEALRKQFNEGLAARQKQDVQDTVNLLVTLVEQQSPKKTVTYTDQAVQTESEKLPEKITGPTPGPAQKQEQQQPKAPRRRSWFKRVCFGITAVAVVVIWALARRKLR